MNREQVIAALHEGMATGVSDFHAWTAGEYLGDWGVESVLTSACARSLAFTAARVGSPKALTIEQTFQGIMDYSKRRGHPGRPTKAASRIANKSTGRVDIVLWNAEATPRAIIEIKRTADTRGLVADAQRVIDFIKHAGATYGGSVRYGLVAIIVSGASSRGRERLLARAGKRQAALEKLATRAKMGFLPHGPKWLDAATAGPDQLACSYVFEFKP
jgi:hypothetical protein